MAQTQLAFPTGVDLSTKSIALYNIYGSEKYLLNLDDPVNFVSLFSRLREICSQFPLTNYIGVDWSPYEAFWGSRKHSQLKALITGILTGYLMTTGRVVVWVPPTEVRKALGLKKPNSSKEEVHRMFTQITGQELSEDLDIADAQIIFAVLLGVLNS